MTRSTSTVEVVNVSPHGFWLLIGDRECFVSFAQFPWFRHATIGELSNVTLPSAHHLYWPDLDIDLAVDSLDDPEDSGAGCQMHPTPRHRRRRLRTRATGSQVQFRDNSAP